MARPLTARIDLHALEHNLQLAAKQCPQSALCAIIKADAYGHGAVPVARFLQRCGIEGVRGVGVCSMGEALELRQEHIDMPVVLLEGIFTAEEAQYAREYQLSPVIHSQWQLEALQDMWRPQDPPLWIKLNSGMNRLGLSQQQCSDAIEQLEQGGYALVLMSHYASADSNNSQTLQQYRRCQALAQSSKHATSFGNSAAVLYHADMVGDIARPGIMTYGATPDNSDPFSIGLRPVMHLHSRIIAMHQLEAGASVGYGGSWQAQKPSRIATVAGGYADGYPREINPQAYVTIADTPCPVVGRVSMDMLAVDVTGCPEAHRDSDVQLWGNNPTINQVAAWHGTIAYTLLSRVHHRVPRSYSHG